MRPTIIQTSVKAPRGQRGRDGGGVLIPLVTTVHWSESSLATDSTSDLFDNCFMRLPRSGIIKKFNIMMVFRRQTTVKISLLHKTADKTLTLPKTIANVTVSGLAGQIVCLDPITVERRVDGGSYISAVASDDGANVNSNIEFL